MEPLDHQATHTEDLTPVAKAALFGARPWMFFILVLGLLYIVLMLLGTIASFASGGFGGVTNLITVAITGYLYWLLFKTTQKIKQFQADGSSDTLEEALLNYKNYWLISGIIVIIAIAFMIFGFLAAIFFSLSM